MVDRLFEVERDPGGDITLRFKPPVSRGLSESSKQHLLAAQKEMLLALRGMLDGVIEATEEMERKREKKKGTRTKIEVQ